MPFMADDADAIADEILGGGGAAPKTKKQPADDADLEAYLDGDQDGDGLANDETEPSAGEVAAAEEALVAFKAGDAVALSKALSTHYDLCAARKAEGE